MQTTGLLFAVCAGALSLAQACKSDEPGRACTPGVSIACVAPGGCQGGQICNDMGTGFGACLCEDNVDSGLRDAMTDANATTDADDTDATAAIDGSMAEDAAADAAQDAGESTGCSLTTHAGCEANERCAWVALSGTTGVARCVPNGVVPVAGACSRGPDGVDTGYDNCARGGICINGHCSAVCDSSVSDSCGLDVCVRYAGLFDPDATDNETPITGACVLACDPVSQELRTGGPCGAGLGCFAGPGGATCAPSTRTLTHGQAITGSPFLNACAAGHMPIANAAGTGYLCVAHCRPVITSFESPAGVAGQAPYSCPSRGAASPPHECVFARFEPTLSAAGLDNVGFCLDRTDRTYDDDQNPETPEVSEPSCTALSVDDDNLNGTPDNAELGCTP